MFFRLAFNREKNENNKSWKYIIFILLPNEGYGFSGQNVGAIIFIELI